MATAMSFGGAAWMAWCLLIGAPWAAMVPAGYIITAIPCLLYQGRTGYQHTCRRVLLTAGLLLPFLFQSILGGMDASGMVMLWSLPALVASVNLQSGVLRYGYLLFTGILFALFSVLDPVLGSGVPTMLSGKVMLAFNLTASMIINFVLADRMLSAQRALRKRIFAIQREEEERFMRTLKERHLEMEQSLDYAGRIQMALWPDHSKLTGLFHEMHVQYRPKEAVGGDLIWHSRVEDRSYFIVLDCTGHGVPGSLMSMLIHGVLNEVVHTGRNLSAADVVRRTQQLLNDRLDRDRTGNTDGAEMAVLCFDHGRRRVSCCGLGCGIIVQEGDEVFRLKSHSGNALLMHGSRLEELREHVVTITPHTRLFLYTDGVVDQFCANDQRKFTRARLEALLYETRTMPPSEQITAFEHAFDTWRGNTPLVDDILLASVVPAPCWYTPNEDGLKSDAA